MVNEPLLCSYRCQVAEAFNGRSQRLKGKSDGCQGVRSLAVLVVDDGLRRQKACENPNDADIGLRPREFASPERDFAVYSDPQVGYPNRKLSSTESTTTETTAGHSVFVVPNCANRRNTVLSESDKNTAVCRSVVIRKLSQGESEELFRMGTAIFADEKLENLSARLDF
jgi:hypothetical protein